MTDFEKLEIAHKVRNGEEEEKEEELASKIEPPFDEERMGPEC